MALTKQASRRSSHPARRIAGQRHSSLSDILRKAAELKAQGGDIIDLALGAPDYAPPEFLTEAAVNAIRSGNNGYGDSRGIKQLRALTSERFASDQNVSYDTDTEVTIAAGASAALSAVLLALVNPNDRVLVFEPFFESFLGQIALAGAKPGFVRLEGPDYAITEKLLKRAFTPRTRAVLLNSPNNPTGRVATADELEVIAWFCRKHDVLVISDEAYAPFVYDGRHISIASLPGMRERTIVLESVSKVFNVSGWRIGNIMAPASLTTAIRKVNDLTLGAPVPLQLACVEALRQYDSFMPQIVRHHMHLRNRLRDAIVAAGFAVHSAEGTYSLFADSKSLGCTSSEQACASLLEDAGILAVPGSSFYRSGTASSAVRFCFARTAVTIERAVKAFERWVHSHSLTARK